MTTTTITMTTNSNDSETPKPATTIENRLSIFQMANHLWQILHKSKKYRK